MCENVGETFGKTGTMGMSVGVSLGDCVWVGGSGCTCVFVCLGESK